MEKFEKEEKFQYHHDEHDPLKDKYGVMPMIRSEGEYEELLQIKYHSLSQITEEHVGQTLRLRIRLQKSIIKGGGGFIILRDQFLTIQGVLFAGETTSKSMIKFAGQIPMESYVEIEGELTKAQKPVERCSIRDFELQISRIYLISEALRQLPMQYEDASRKYNPDEDEEETVVVEKKEEVVEVEKKEEVVEGEGEGEVEGEGNKAEVDGEAKESEKDKKKREKKEKKEKEKKEKKGRQPQEKKEEPKQAIVRINTRLDNRVLDLRVAASQALLRLQSGVGQLFREYMYNNEFIEIHSPKLIAGASEGGTNVFKLKYFNTDACLAQSPQLYKQMAIISDMKRVFEVGPVFRAENANTGRHLCEFMSLDFEMEIKNHYFEVVDLIGELFHYIFNGLNERYKHDLNIVAQQYPFEPIVFGEKLVKLDFITGCELLKEAGVYQDPHEDLSTDTEKLLGELVKKKYGTDFYLLYKYPIAARPFYTMLDPKDENYTNSYDAFIRGEEILSGAQRIHDYELLLTKVKEKGINPETLKDYLNAFRLGAPPHGGAGLGLERIVKLFTGLTNIRRCVMFPRDPKRLTP